VTDKNSDVVCVCVCVTEGKTITKQIDIF